MLLNPGPEDVNLDNILREVLNVEDLESFGDDMNKVDTLSMQLGNVPIRDLVLDCLKYVSIIKKHEVVSNILPRHQIDEFMKYLTSIESMTAKCLERPTTSQNPNAHDVLASTSGSRDAVPSTSGINTKHASSR